MLLAGTCNWTEVVHGSGWGLGYRRGMKRTAVNKAECAGLTLATMSCAAGVNLIE